MFSVMYFGIERSDSELAEEERKVGWVVRCASTSAITERERERKVISVRKIALGSFSFSFFTWGRKIVFSSSFISSSPMLSEEKKIAFARENLISRCRCSCKETCKSFSPLLCINRRWGGKEENARNEEEKFSLWKRRKNSSAKAR